MFDYVEDWMKRRCSRESVAADTLLRDALKRFALTDEDELRSTFRRLLAHGTLSMNASSLVTTRKEETTMSTLADNILEFTKIARAQTTHENSGRVEVTVSTPAGYANFRVSLRAYASQDDLDPCAKCHGYGDTIDSASTVALTGFKQKLAEDIDLESTRIATVRRALAGE